MDPFKTIGYLLKDVSRRYAARFEVHAEEVSLTLMQCKVLLYLSKNEGASQVRLCDLTEIEPMMMVRILDRMEATVVHGGCTSRARPRGCSMRSTASASSRATNSLPA